MPDGPMGTDLMHRWERNPILTMNDVPFRANTVFNCSPVKVDGRYIMMVRIEGQQGHSVFALARSPDGLHFAIDPEPAMLPTIDPPWQIWEENGIEDPRLTLLDGVYYIMYTALSRYGHYIALARTEDFQTFERMGVVSGPGNKDGVLFPEKIGGLYARLDRPFGNDVGCVWISYSPDLIHWGRSEMVFGPRERFWDSYRVGASCPPIRTKRGWLEIYHGTKMTPAGPIYRAGTIMLDPDNPARVLGRCLAPVLSPREDYERIGDVNNVVFASGAIVEDDGELKLYYGAADTSICLATASLDELIESCFQAPQAASGRR